MLNAGCFTRLFATAAFLSQTVLGVSGEIALKTSEELNVYLVSSLENAHRTVDGIIQMHPDEWTFDNTLGKWNRMADELADMMKTLAPIEHPQMLQDVLSVLNIEIFQNAVLGNILISCAQNFSSDEMLNPFQRYVARRFLENVYQQQTLPSSFAYIQGMAEDNDIQEENFMVFNHRIQDEQAVPLANILNSKADIVCLQGIAGMEQLEGFYEALKEQYAHFYTTMDCRGFSSDFLNSSRGTLIASKYHIEQPQYTLIAIENKSSSQEKKSIEKTFELRQEISSVGRRTQHQRSTPIQH